MRYYIFCLFPLLFIPACGGSSSSSGSNVDNSSETKSFRVSAVSPTDGTVLPVFPQTISVTFNRTPAKDSPSMDNIQVWQSGEDANFSSGNETQIFANSLTTTNTAVSLNFGGTNLNDDSFQIRVISDATLTDSDGILLDGDGDDIAGGNFTSIFRTNGSTPTSPSFASIQIIFSNNCAFSGCHSGASPAQGQDLTAGQAYANIVGISSTEVPGLQRIEPGNPDGSYLVQKIEGRAAVGSRMPLGRSPLSAQQIQDIRDWVSAGALDN